MVGIYKEMGAYVEEYEFYLEVSLCGAAKQLEMSVSYSALTLTKPNYIHVGQDSCLHLYDSHSRTLHSVASQLICEYCSAHYMCNVVALPANGTCLLSRSC